MLRNKYSAAAAALLFNVIAAASLSAQERYLKPVDEAHLDASFAEFRKRLITAAEARDTAYVVGIIDPKIQFSFGGDSGIRDFRRHWKLEQRSSKFWDEFLPVIKNGGSFLREGGRRTGVFYAPYTFNSFPEDLDMFEYKAVVGENVNLREQPNTTSAVVASLSYNIVKIDYDNSIKVPNTEGDVSWYKVETLGGLKGFVKGEYVRGPADYRAGFEKKNGRWRMVTFIAGD